MSYLRPALRPRTRPSWYAGLPSCPRPRWSSAALRPYTTPTDSDSAWPHPVSSSSRLTDRKSIFLAHASILPHPTALPRLLDHLRTLPRSKRATHCMYAYRAAGVAGQSDGGEGGSGDRLARLLRLTGCEDVVVVVWRWYGGVKLGNDRWKRISEVAREALDAGGFLVKQDNKADKKKKKK